MDYKLKINKRKTLSGTTIRANLVAEDKNGKGVATGSVDIPIVISADDMSDREYCLIREGEIDSVLTSSNPGMVLTNSISGLKECLNSNPDDAPTTKTSAIIPDTEGISVVDRDDVDVATYINSVDYSIKIHPKYNGTDEEGEELIFRVPIIIERNQTQVRIEKHFILRGYSKNDVITALKNLFEDKEYAASFLFNIIRGNNAIPEEVFDNFSKDLLGDALTQRLLTNGYNNSRLYDLLYQYTTMTEDSLPKLEIIPGDNTDVPGLTYEGSDLTFNRPEAKDRGRYNSAVEVTRDGKYLVGYLVTNDSSSISAKLYYDDATDPVIIRTNQIKVRTKNITIQEINNNVKKGMKPYWYQFLPPEVTSITSTGAEPITLKFGNKNYIKLRIPLCPKGICTEYNTATSGSAQVNDGIAQIIPDDSNIGYSVRLGSTGEPVEKGFNTVNGESGNVFESRLVTEDNSNSKIGFYLVPSQLTSFGGATGLNDENLSTADDGYHNIKSRSVDFQKIVTDNFIDGTDYIVLVFSKNDFIEADVTEFNFSHEIKIRQNYNKALTGLEKHLDTSSNEHEITNVVNFKIKIEE